MAEEDARRAAFKENAPELRRILVAELSSALDAAAAFSAAEAAVLRHLFDHAGFALSGHLFVPTLAALWGEELSYVPAVRLPVPDVRRAVAILRRRGVLAAGPTGGVVVDADALRAACAPPAAPAPATKRRPGKARKTAASRKPRRPRG